MLVIVVLYWAQAVFVPIALAVLLTFVLTPPVGWLERWLGRVPAVLAAVTLVFIVLGLAGWGLARQMDHLADDLPTYRVNILAKIADVRGAGKEDRSRSFKRRSKVSRPILDNRARRNDLPARCGHPSRSGFSGFSWLGPIVGPVGTAGLVLALVIFMLLERRDLRDRLIGLFGYGQLTVTTKAFDEAGTRVSRQLLMQSLVNLVYGIAAGRGSMPSACRTRCLGGARCGPRFIPAIGPVIGAGAPILVSLAALPGWSGPLWVVGLFVVLELFTNLVLETVLYAGAAGVPRWRCSCPWPSGRGCGDRSACSPTPLTVCLVVLGKHVRVSSSSGC